MGAKYPDPGVFHMTKQQLWRKRKRDEYIARKYGEEFVGIRMGGRHGNHASGEREGRWAGERRIVSNGYVAVRVPIDHPHAWGPPSLKRFKYAYEHHIVAMGMIGRPLLQNETVHHKNGDKTDNRPENIEVMDRSEHAVHHNETRPRDPSTGRFIRQYPEAR